jgi:hypothetical protein
MGRHEVYACIIKAVKAGSLTEPFSKEDFRNACPGFGEGTYNAFLWKHTVGNPKKRAELFIKVLPGKFKLVRPFKYGLGG